jgi:hypothetical protein
MCFKYQHGGKEKHVNQSRTADTLHRTVSLHDKCKNKLHFGHRVVLDFTKALTVQIP